MCRIFHTVALRPRHVNVFGILLSTFLQLSLPHGASDSQSCDFEAVEASSRPAPASSYHSLLQHRSDWRRHVHGADNVETRNRTLAKTRNTNEAKADDDDGAARPRTQREIEQLIAQELPAILKHRSLLPEGTDGDSHEATAPSAEGAGESASEERRAPEVEAKGSSQPAGRNGAKSGKRAVPEPAAPKEKREKEGAAAPNPGTELWAELHREPKAKPKVQRKAKVTAEPTDASKEQPREKLHQTGKQEDKIGAKAKPYMKPDAQPMAKPDAQKGPTGPTKSKPEAKPRSSKVELKSEAKAVQNMPKTEPKREQKGKSKSEPKPEKVTAKTELKARLDPEWKTTVSTVLEPEQKEGASKKEVATPKARHQMAKAGAADAKPAEKPIARLRAANRTKFKLARKAELNAAKLREQQAAVQAKPDVKLNAGWEVRVNVAEAQGKTKPRTAAKAEQNLKPKVEQIEVPKAGNKGPQAAKAVSARIQEQRESRQEEKAHLVTDRLKSQTESQSRQGQESSSVKQRLHNQSFASPPSPKKSLYEVHPKKLGSVAHTNGNRGASAVGPKDDFQSATDSSRVRHIHGRRSLSKLQNSASLEEGESAEDEKELPRRTARAKVRVPRFARRAPVLGFSEAQRKIPRKSRMTRAAKQSDKKDHLVVLHKRAKNTLRQRVQGEEQEAGVPRGRGEQAKAHRGQSKSRRTARRQAADGVSRSSHRSRRQAADGVAGVREQRGELRSKASHSRSHVPAERTLSRKKHPKRRVVSKSVGVDRGHRVRRVKSDANKEEPLRRASHTPPTKGKRVQHSAKFIGKHAAHAQHKKSMHDANECMDCGETLRSSFNQVKAALIQNIREVFMFLGAVIFMWLFLGSGKQASGVVQEADPQADKDLMMHGKIESLVQHVAREAVTSSSPADAAKRGTVQEPAEMLDTPAAAEEKAPAQSTAAAAAEEGIAEQESPEKAPDEQQEAGVEKGNEKQEAGSEKAPDQNTGGEDAPDKQAAADAAPKSDPKKAYIEEKLKEAKAKTAAKKALIDKAKSARAATSEQMASLAEADQAKETTASEGGAAKEGEQQEESPPAKAVNRKEALRELSSMRAKQKERKKEEKALEESTAASEAKVRSLDMSMSDMRQEEEKAEKAFKKLPSELRSAAVEKIGKKRWATIPWRERLAAAQAALQADEEPPPPQNAPSAAEVPKTSGGTQLPADKAVAPKAAVKGKLAKKGVPAAEDASPREKDSLKFNERAEEDTTET
mmetsp:Transcript_95377/g.179357  ORF Transcript_95377/g.179357 Transcript_95377/m.179357 type:complete len:1245 (-) Transcript_95377:34-3768(-)